MTRDETPLNTEVSALRDEFLMRVRDLRPSLHRYCSRMVGSLLDGEDVVQESLTHAFYRLSSLRNWNSLKSWLFGIAHNRCIDFLRAPRREILLDEIAKASARSTHQIDETLEASVSPIDRAQVRQEVGIALEAIVGGLPRKNARLFC